MLTKFVHFFWPDLHKEELKKYTILGMIFFLIIGTYWLVGLAKNTIFFKIAFPSQFGWPANYGCLMQPIAKFWSPFVIILLILLYSKIIDLFEKHTVFYLLCSLYTFLFGGITLLLALRHFYGDMYLGKNILAGIGWLSFFATDSFGALLITLFWSFTISISTTQSAQRSYPFLVTMAQCGAITGSLINLGSLQFGGIWTFFLIATATSIIIGCLMYYFMRVIPPQQQIGNPEAHTTENKKEGFLKGFFSGLILLITKPYVLCILVISTFYEIITQIVEYQMQTSAHEHPSFCQEDVFAQFQGMYGISVNTLALLMAFFGTSYLLKRFGIRFCLLVFPVCLATAFISLFVFFNLGNPTAGQFLWATFGVMLLAKGLAYGLNNPVKEMLYIPTSKDIRFKTKGWIDMFAFRAAQQTGAQINNIFKNNIGNLMIFGTLISCGITVVWIFAAIYVANKNKHLIKIGTIIE
ncbi:MAG: hypothetical protein NTX86_00825 [Candidatus Dependentiae bacterium]|nr:hypothetical protein [Candidatus Dependentiae bacterium]